MYFEDLIPKVHDIDILEPEFSRGDSVILVLEKIKAIDEASKLIGKCSIKMNMDWEKKKNLPKSNGLDSNNLLSEYGSYIFCFPDVELNKAKISKTFGSLPNTKNFVIESNS